MITKPQKHECLCFCDGSTFDNLHHSSDTFHPSLLKTQKDSPSKVFFIQLFFNSENRAIIRVSFCLNLLHSFIGVAVYAITYWSFTKSMDHDEREKLFFFLYKNNCFVLFCFVLFCFVCFYFIHVFSIPRHSLGFSFYLCNAGCLTSLLGCACAFSATGKQHNGPLSQQQVDSYFKYTDEIIE